MPIEASGKSGQVVVNVSNEPDVKPAIWFMHVGCRSQNGVGAKIDALLKHQGFTYLGKKTGEHAYGKIDHDYEIWNRTVTST